MKTRDSLQKEATEIIRILSIYRTLMYEQIIRMFPNKSEIIEKLIARLINQKRIIYEEETAMLSYGPDKNDNPDLNLILAFWVLADFLDEAEYHFPSEFPAQIAFFMDHKFYEIIVIEHGKEAMINRVLAIKNREQSNKIIIVRNEKQIPKVTAENIFCFCVVGKTGEIEYFNFE